jgi:hypothetical protein
MGGLVVAGGLVFISFLGIWFIGFVDKLEMLA